MEQSRCTEGTERPSYESMGGASARGVPEPLAATLAAGAFHARGRSEKSYFISHLKGTACLMQHRAALSSRNAQDGTHPGLS